MNRGWMVAGVLAFVAAPAVPAAAAGVAMVLERVEDPAGMLRWIRTGDVLRYEVRLNGMGRDAQLAVAATPVHSLTGLSCARVRPSDTPDYGGAGITARALASRALAAPEGAVVPGAAACRLGDLSSERAVQVEVSVPSGTEEVEVAAVARMREEDGDLTTVTRTTTAQVIADPPLDERIMKGPALRIPDDGRTRASETARQPRWEIGGGDEGDEPVGRRVRADEVAAGMGERGRGRWEIGGADEGPGGEPVRRRVRADEMAAGMGARSRSRGEIDAPGEGDEPVGRRVGADEVAAGMGERSRARREIGGGEPGGRREAGAAEPGEQGLDPWAPAAEPGERLRARGDEMAGERGHDRPETGTSETATRETVTEPGERERGRAREAGAREPGRSLAQRKDQGEQGSGTAEAKPWSEPETPGFEFPEAAREGQWPGTPDRGQSPQVAPPPVEGAPGAPLPRAVEGSKMQVRAEERINPLAGVAGLPYVAGGIGVLLVGLWAVAGAQSRRLRRKVF